MRLDSLRRLAQLYGVQVAYEDVDHIRQQATDEALVRAVQLLGGPIERPDDAPGEIRRWREEKWRRPLEPVTVVWADRPAGIRLRLPVSDCGGKYRCTLHCEDGSDREFGGKVEQLPTVRDRRIEGSRYIVKRLEVAGPLPWGYHRLALECGATHASTLLIVAPRKCWQAPREEQRPYWGVFLPLYALHSERSWGEGDFTDLEELMLWVARQGGSLVATLPLLASLWDLSDDPSPYSPVSRLFWNELYLDIARVPEMAHCQKARVLMESPEVRGDLQTLRDHRLIDYGRLVALKRKLLGALAEALYDQPSSRRDEFDRYVAEHPEVEAYARFRAVGQRQGKTWTHWPEPLRDGRIEPGQYDPEVARYHMYAQWQIEQQLGALAAKARSENMLWYLDFPLGVSHAGYDVWKNRELFVLGASGGTPPDSFFTKGQNWGFPPMHPQRLRDDGYRHLIDCFRRHLRYARVLRIDHVMSLYRLYWVPHGMDATEGVYIRYSMEELLAVLALESHRHQAIVVGENLGTVADELDRGMQRHGVQGMYVFQYETHADKDPPFPPVPEDEVASINTHDMPPFAAFWNALDVEERLDLGLLSEEEAVAERRNREIVRQGVVRFLRRRGLLADDADDTESVLQGCLAFLAESPAPLVLASLEDLWQETEPQNTPGTFKERPNWRRKAQYTFEEFRDMPTVLRILQTIEAGRRRAEQ